MDNTITLSDEWGREVRFKFLDLVSFEDREYVICLSADAEDGAVTILYLEGSDGESESYVSVEDEDELAAVFDIFKDKWKSEFDFAEE